MAVVIGSQASAYLLASVSFVFLRQFWFLKGSVTKLKKDWAGAKRYGESLPL